MAPSRRRCKQPNSAEVGDSILVALGAMEDEEEPPLSMKVRKGKLGIRSSTTIADGMAVLRSGRFSTSSGGSDETDGDEEEDSDGEISVEEEDIDNENSTEESDEEEVSDAGTSSVASFRGDPRTAEGFGGDDASTSDEGEDYGLDGDESDFDPEEISEDEEDDDESVLEEVEDADEIYAALRQKNNGSAGAKKSSVVNQTDQASEQGTSEGDSNVSFSDFGDETCSPIDRSDVTTADEIDRHHDGKGITTRSPNTTESSVNSSVDGPNQIESFRADTETGIALQRESTIAVEQDDVSFGGNDTFDCDSGNKSVDPDTPRTFSFCEKKKEQQDRGSVGDTRTALSPHLHPPVEHITMVAGNADIEFMSPLATSLRDASRLSRKNSVVNDVVVAMIVEDSDDESSEIEEVVAEIVDSDDEDDETVVQSPVLSSRCASTSPPADLFSDGKNYQNLSRRNDTTEAANGASNQVATTESEFACPLALQYNISESESLAQSKTSRKVSSIFSKVPLTEKGSIVLGRSGFNRSPSGDPLPSERANSSSECQAFLSGPRQSDSMATEMACKSRVQANTNPFQCPDQQESSELGCQFFPEESDSLSVATPRASKNLEYASPISETKTASTLQHDGNVAHDSARAAPPPSSEQPTPPYNVGRRSSAECENETTLVQTTSCSVDTFASNKSTAVSRNLLRRNNGRNQTVCGIRDDANHYSECFLSSNYVPAKDLSPGADVICATTGSGGTPMVDYLCSRSAVTNCRTMAGDFQGVLSPQERSSAGIEARPRKEVKFLLPNEATGVDLASLGSGKENSSLLATTILPSGKKPAQQSREDLIGHGVRREGIIKRGQWKLGSKIGSGAFGVVHIGMNMETGKLMAVKSLRMEAAVMNDAKREVQLLKALEHTNIVRYYGAEMDSKYLHIFQEWIPGGSVTSLLAKFGPFPINVLRSYLLQTITGLEYLHSMNIMHRDIKGSNILVNDEGIVKLADFGAGKCLGGWNTDMMLSMTMRGTPYFMAPEVFEEKYSRKADIWSVGCVAFQMATGTPPWKALGCTNPVSLFQHISKSDGPPVMDINESDAVCGAREGRQILGLFKKVVASCFQRDPERRPSAHALLSNTFFSIEASPAVDNDAETSFLFSPLSAPKGNNRASPFRTAMSPMSPATTRRRNSFDACRSPFFSPPLPRSAVKRSSRPPLSPQPDTSDWPTWAREKLHADSVEDTCISQNGALTIDSLAYSVSPSSTSAGSTPLKGEDFITSISSPFTKIPCGVKRES